jgi:branched-chain amino acid transport system substrate-binding protein
MTYATENTNATDAGREFQITYYDTLGDPTTGAALAVQAFEQDGMDFLVGGTSSAVAAAISPIAEQYEKLYFISPGADSELTASKFNKYIFRVARNNWHDAKAGIQYAIDTVGAKNFAFLAADYSFGWSGVTTMSAEVTARGGRVVATEYALLYQADYSTQMTNLLAADTLTGIDMLILIWAGDFSVLYRDIMANNIPTSMNMSTAVIDLLSMNTIEATLTPPATLINSTGLSLYGYKLPDNDVNDWMVQAHVDRNIKPNGAFLLNYRVPELFTASGFGTAQFLIEAANAVPDLDTDKMICYLEGLNITTPKGPTYMRPTDHQGLAEMYIAKIVNDTDSTSETYNMLVGELVERLPALSVAPPVGTTYTPCAPEPVLTTITGAGTTIVSTIPGNGTTQVTTDISTTTVTPGFITQVVLLGLCSFAVISINRHKRKNG